MKIDFLICTFTPSKFLAQCLKELYPPLVCYPCERSFRQDWMEKKIPVRLVIEPDKILIDSWERSYKFDFPLLYQDMESVFQSLSQKEYFSFSGHGLCAETLCDPQEQKIMLCPKEAELLGYLMQYPGRSKEQFLRDVWKYDPGVVHSTHTLETHLSSLRSKLERSCHPLEITYDKETYCLV